MSDDFERCFREEVKEQAAGGPGWIVEVPKRPIRGRRAPRPAEAQGRFGWLPFVLGFFGALMGTAIGVLLFGSSGSLMTCLCGGIGFATGSAVGRHLRGS